MLVLLCIWVHDAAVYLAVSILMHTYTGSFRLYDLSIETIWNYIRKSIVQPLFFLIAVVFLLPSH